MNKQHNIAKQYFTLHINALTLKTMRLAMCIKIQLSKIRIYQSYYCISCIQKSTAFLIN